MYAYLLAGYVRTNTRTLIHARLNTSICMCTCMLTHSNIQTGASYKTLA